MWKRERMMVDVISLQNKPDVNNNNNTAVTTTTTTIPSIQPLLQNRQCYPFQGIHDNTNNYYAGNEYNMFGDVTCSNKRKRPLPTTGTIDNTTTTTAAVKRQKTLIQEHHDQVLKTGYTFTSKPYDVMDNLMYYY